VPSFQNIVSVAASQKTRFWRPKMENALSWDKTENDLRGVPRHPKVHARVRYMIVMAKYLIIKGMT
jgi:hypothetical protein